MTGAPADELDCMDGEGTTLRILVDTIVIIVVWPPGKVIVTVVNTLEVASGTEPEVGSDKALLNPVMEPLIGVEAPLEDVVEGVTGVPVN